MEVMDFRNQAAVRVSMGHHEEVERCHCVKQHRPQPCKK